MDRQAILKYLNAENEHRANINLLNYTEQKISITFNEEGVTLSEGKAKKTLKYKCFTKEYFEELTSL